MLRADEAVRCRAPASLSIGLRVDDLPSPVPFRTHSCATARLRSGQRADAGNDPGSRADDRQARLRTSRPLRALDPSGFDARTLAQARALQLKDPPQARA